MEQKIVKMIRRVFRIAGVVFWFLAAGIYVAAVNRKGGWEKKRRAAELTRKWAVLSAKIAGVHVNVHGDAAAFPGGLVVGNHQSYLDIPVHASVFALRFAPKAEMRCWPLLGWLTSRNEPVWIDRSSRQKSREVAGEIAATLKNHISMIVYPEGTTSDGLHGLLPFKSTPFEAAIESGAPVQPVLTFYRCEPAGESAAWFGDDPLAGHIWRILGLKKVVAEVYIMPLMKAEVGETRKAFAERVRNNMCEEYSGRMQQNGGD